MALAAPAAGGGNVAAVEDAEVAEPQDGAGLSGTGLEADAATLQEANLDSGGLSGAVRGKTDDGKFELGPQRELKAEATSLRYLLFHDR